MKKFGTMVLAVCLLLGIAACSTGASKPDKVVSGMLDAIKTGEKDKIQKYVDYDKAFVNGENTQQSDEERVKQIITGIEYEILSTNEDGDTAVVETKIRNVDMKKVFTEYWTNAMGVIISNTMGEGDGEKLSQEQINQKLKETLAAAIDNNKDNRTDHTVPITLNKVNGAWQVVFDDALLDAIMGGFLSAQKEMQENVPQ